MSKLIEQFKALAAKQDELGLAPDRSAGSLIIPCDGTRTEFSVIAEGEHNRAFVIVENARFVNARVSLQRYSDKNKAMYRADVNDPDGWQYVADLGFAVRAQIGVLDVDDGEEIVVPTSMETHIWGPASVNGKLPVVFIHGHHQGVPQAAADELKALLLARGWVTPPVREVIGAKRRMEVGPKLGWNLTTRGAGQNGRPTTDQYKLTNGALAAMEITVRPNRRADDSGEVGGFGDFITAANENHMRWLLNREALPVGAEKDDRQVVDNGLFSLTGARSRMVDGKLVTNLDRADTPEFVVNTGTVEEPVPTTISLWPANEEAASAEDAAANGPVPTGNSL